MAKPNILFLVHRLPFPPNKGDKVRSFQLLKYLSARSNVFLGTFVDAKEDEQHVDSVTRYCAELHASRLYPGLSKIKSLTGLFAGRALGLAYYRSRSMWQWVQSVAERHRFDSIVVFSSVMSQYVQASPRLASVPLLVDFVDVDSSKWTAYADDHQWPLSWLYRREGVKLLAHERLTALQSQKSFFVTDSEARLFKTAAPECSALVETVCNGVDSEFFSPNAGRPSPFGGDSRPDMLPIVFTGAMDYWPNIDAALWFASNVLPPLRRVCPNAVFYIVGRSPGRGLLSLAGDDVVVTGTVADVRPYLQHAAVVVAPLRVARGIQNKILEAMAMARPVVAARICTKPMDVVDGEHLVSAESAVDYVEKIKNLLDNMPWAATIGQKGRAQVLKSYSWQAHLQKLDQYLPVTNQGLPV